MSSERERSEVLKRFGATDSEAAKLLADARDGPGVTETERETLRWVCASFGMTRAARSYLLEQCSVPAGWVVK